MSDLIDNAQNVRRWLDEKGQHEKADAVSALVIAYQTLKNAKPAEQQPGELLEAFSEARRRYKLHSSVSAFQQGAIFMRQRILSIQPTQQALREAAFDKGFLLAASWAGRDDLHHDQGSRAYLEERDAALRGEGEKK